MQHILQLNKHLTTQVLLGHDENTVLASATDLAEHQASWLQGLGCCLTKPPQTGPG